MLHSARLCSHQAVARCEILQILLTSSGCELRHVRLPGTFRIKRMSDVSCDIPPPRVISHLFDVRCEALPEYVHNPPDMMSSDLTSHLPNVRFEMSFSPGYTPLRLM